MKSLTILSGKAMIVEMPDGVRHWRMDYWIRNHLLYWPKGKGHADDFNIILLPPGNWQIVGMLSEVTEEQADVMVESDEQYGVTMYRNYKTTGMPYYDEQITALESLESAIRAEGLYLDSPPFKQTKFTNPDIWESVMSRVLSRERCLLLSRVDE